jgi:hypothetical protein
MTTLVCTSSSLMVWTSDRFARRDDGKAVGLECVTTVLEDVSLHDAPQMAHVKVTFFLPALPSSRLPQSLQKMSEPIADMMVLYVFGGLVVWLFCEEEKVTRSRELLRGADALPQLQR